MPERQIIDAMWDDSPVDVSKETSMIWSIANKLRGTYQSDKYKEVIISMTIIRLFECVLAAAKGKVEGYMNSTSELPGQNLVQCCELLVLQGQEVSVCCGKVAWAFLVCVLEGVY